MVVFVGDQPSKCTDPLVPFKGAKCEKRLLAWIAELKVTQYVIINRVSLEFDSTATQATAHSWPIIALGLAASKALKDRPHFRLPHPSGLNRQINDKTFIDAQILACSKYITSL